MNTRFDGGEIMVGVLMVTIAAFIAGAAIVYIFISAELSDFKTEVAVLTERNANQQKILSLISKQMPPCECGAAHKRILDTR